MPFRGAVPHAYVGVNIPKHVEQNPRRKHPRPPMRAFLLKVRVEFVVLREREGERKGK